jgi:hypothetical protein
MPSIFNDPSAQWVSVSMNQRAIVFHCVKLADLRSIIAIELSNLSIKICVVLSIIGCSQYCLAALINNLIEGILGHWNVSHNVIEKCVLRE